MPLGLSRFTLPPALYENASCSTSSLKIGMVGDRVKMAEEQDVEFTFSHKYIKNTCETILTEYLLNIFTEYPHWISTGRRPQTSKRAKKNLHITGQDKGKKEERKESGLRSGPLGGIWEGTVKEKRVPPTGKFLHRREISQDRGAALEPQSRV